MSMAKAILQLDELSKSFGSTTALTRFTLEVRRGEVLGIVGENGAGKSTLLNILSGIVRPDSGAMRLGGNRYEPTSYSQALVAGVSRVFQEQALIPTIPAYENLLLAHDRRFARAGQWLRTRDMIEAADAMMKSAGVLLDVRKQTSELSFSKRQLLEIVRAMLVPGDLLGIGSPVVLMDEPTASLEKEDEHIFFSLVERLRSRAALVFISHRLGEVIALSDRIAVMKDGKLVGELLPDEAIESRLHAMMVGRQRAKDYYHEARQLDVAGRKPIFSLRGLTRSGYYENVDLDVREGEILGIGGLLASGTAPLGKGAAGIIAASGGDVLIGGETQSRPAIARLIRKGLGYIPAERLAEGMITSLPISWNLSLASGADVFSSALGMWDTNKERVATLSAMASLSIKAAGPDVIGATLSGGNQQKVVIARWLCRDLKVLILDNPTRGVDAGAKEEIYRIIRDLSARGVAILLISDELLELIGLSNRIAIMQRGRIAAVIDAPPEAKPGEHQLIELMLTVSHEAANARIAA